MLHIDDAVLADAVVSPGSLALGEIEAAAATRWLRLSKPNLRRRTTVDGFAVATDDGVTTDDEDDSRVTYTLSHRPALSTDANTFTPQFLSELCDGAVQRANRVDRRPSQSRTTATRWSV